MHDLLGHPPDKLPPDLVEFLDWLERLKRPGETAARIDAIDLMVKWRLAPRMEIADVIRYADGHLRYRWRFVGSAICAAWGTEDTGRYMDETETPAAVEELSDHFGQVVETGRPHYARRRVSGAHHDRSFIGFQRIAAPLSDHTEAITRIIICTVFDSPWEAGR